MNSADNKVKIYACNAATNNSNVFMNTMNGIDTKDIPILSKIKIKDTKLKIKM